MSNKEDPPQPVHTEEEGFTPKEIEQDRTGNAEWREFGKTDDFAKEIAELKADVTTEELMDQRDEVERTEEE